MKKLTWYRKGYRCMESSRGGMESSKFMDSYSQIESSQRGAKDTRWFHRERSDIFVTVISVHAPTAR